MHYILNLPTRLPCRRVEDPSAQERRVAAEEAARRDLELDGARGRLGEGRQSSLYGTRGEGSQSSTEAAPEHEASRPLPRDALYTAAPRDALETPARRVTSSRHSVTPWLSKSRPYGPRTLSLASEARSNFFDHAPRLRPPVHTYNGSVEARRALFPLALVARNGLARSASGSVFLRHMGH